MANAMEMNAAAAANVPRIPAAKSPSFAARALNLDHRFELALRLNDWSFAFAYRSLAFAYATSKPKNENYRAHCNQKFSHRGSPFQNAWVSKHHRYS